MMKKLIAVMLVLMMLIPAAMAENATETESTAGICGGWTTAKDKTITKEIRSLVKKATKDLVGVKYEPVRYLGSQVVAGTNHRILCKATAVYPDAEPTMKILYLYEDLSGNVTITKIVDAD